LPTHDAYCAKAKLPKARKQQLKPLHVHLEN
jgi:hypothetical protein